MEPHTSLLSMTLRWCGLLICLALLAGSAAAVSTEVHVVKLAADGTTVLAERTVDYRWLETNMQVRGDGSTHYYHQGPTFDDADLWDPTESKNVQDKDMGAVKGTAVRDLCSLVGGMQSGDTLAVRSADGFSKKFSYRTVYSPTARQGPMVLTWYRADEGYVPSYSTGMRIVFFADTSTNPYGLHVFGNSDMKASMPQSEWHYFNGVYPTTTGLSVQSVSELRILSSLPASTTAPVTTRTTVAPTATPKATPTGTASVTTTGTKTPSPTVTPSATGSAVTTSMTSSPSTGGSTPVATTILPATTAGAGTVTTVPSGAATVTTGTGSDGTDTEPTATTTTATVTTATSATSTATAATGTPSTSPTATAAPNATVNVSAAPTALPTPTSTDYSSSTDWSYSSSLDYSTVESGTVTATATPTPTPEATTVPVATPLAAGGDAPLVMETASDAPTETGPVTVTTDDGSYNRTVTRSLGFTFSYSVRESGEGPRPAPGLAGRAGIISPYSPLGAIWSAMKAIGAMIDPIFS